MRYGAIFPQRDIGTDVGMIREYVAGIQDLGFDHLVIYDHVLGADTADRPGWTGYDLDDGFHEVFVLLGFIAAIAPGLELVTDILILPQRQTVLVAKQATEVDILSGGRFRLGVGVGWNQVEYEALGEDFRTRGRRVEEQIDLLRRLWTERSLDYTGAHHRIPNAGLTYMPVQRPIPVWIGGSADVTLDRVGRLGDGWFPLGTPDAVMAERIERIRRVAVDHGRDPRTIGFEPTIPLRADPATWRDTAGAWERIGATHLALDTMNTGSVTVADHLSLLSRWRSRVIDG